MSQVLFKTATKENKSFEDDMPDLEEYEEYPLADFEKDADGNNSTFIGKPILGQRYSWESKKMNFDTGEKTGEMVMNYRAKLLVINEENKEYVSTQLKLKDDKDMIEAWSKSQPFDLVDSIQGISDPEWKDKHNVINVSFNEIHEIVNSLKEVTIEIIPHQSKIKGNTIFWNTMRIIEIGE